MERKGRGEEGKGQEEVKWRRRGST